jgi:cysteine desulfurase
MSGRIYFDHAATTPLDPEVWQAMADIQASAYGNPSSIHAEGRLSRTVIEEARKMVARHLGASLGEIYFTSCGTESNNMVLLGAVRDLGIRRILSSPVEHPCVLLMLDYLRQNHGTEVELLPLNACGQVREEALARAMSAPDAPPTLVSLMHVNNELGVMHDLERIGGLCHAHGALFHSDTVQSLGFHAFDLESLPVDFISGSAHKFYGPKGCGLVYIRSGLAFRPLLHGGSQERNMRAGTENILGIHGLATALDRAGSRLPERLAHLQGIRQHLRARLLANIPGLSVNEAPEGEQSPKILSVNFPPGPRTEMLLMHLDIVGVSASGGSACSSGVETASHVLSHLDITQDTRTVRFSFSPWNSLEEADRVVGLITPLFQEKTLPAS